MADGQRIHRVVDRESDGSTRTQAEAFIQKVRSDAKNDRLALPKGRKVALAIRKAAAKYLDRLKVEGGKDLKMKRQRLELHLVPVFGDYSLNKISGFDIERYKPLAPEGTRVSAAAWQDHRPRRRQDHHREAQHD